MSIKRYFKAFFFLSLVFAVFSCGKDKVLSSEKNEVTTTKAGSVYVLDTQASKVEWKGYKIFKSENTGHFGTVKFKDGEITVKDGHLESGKFAADLATLTSEDLKGDTEGLNKLNGHLQSADFFDVAKFPVATYEITKISAGAGDFNTVLDGNLTVKGITKPVQFKANVSVKDGVATIATQPTDVGRQDFGVKFQMPAADGLIKNEMTLQIFVKAIEKK